MGTPATANMSLPSRRLTASTSGGERTWDLAFLGLLFYLIVEYTRLGEMYPLLGSLKVSKIAAGIAVLGYLLAPRFRTAHDSQRGRIDLLVILFLLVCFISACLARYQETAWDGFLDFLRWGVVYFLMTRILTNSWRVRIFVLLLLLLNFKLAQFNIRDFLSRKSATQDEMMLVTMGVGAGTTDFFGNASDFGVAMCVAWGLAGSLLFWDAKRLLRFFLWLCFATFLIAILVCGSRGAIVGACGIALAAFVKNPRKLLPVFMSLLLLAGSVCVLPEASKERFRRAWNWQSDQTSSARVMLWKAGLRLFEEHPVLGVGINNYALTRVHFDESGVQYPTPSAAHSIYISVLSELGLMGSLCFLAFLVLFFRANAQTRKSLLVLGAAGRHSFEFCLAVGLDLALIGYLVSGVFVSVFGYPHLWFLLGVSVALHTACAQNQPAPAAATIPNTRKFALTARRV